MQAIAIRTWSRDSQFVPMDEAHPARRWLAHRHLWRAGFPLPGSLRWLPAEAHYQGRGKHTGAGSLVALVAPPDAWTAAWPDLPVPHAVQLIAVDAQGAPALDRPSEAGGLSKRSLSSTTGLVVVFGCPHLAEVLEPVRVAEGVADALALALSRVNYICRLASISFAGSPPRPGRVAGRRWSGSWGRQTPG